MSSRHIIHVDMDAFYASVEVRERPELAGVPLVVGASAERRGVVAAASYEARRFGIHSAMAMVEAHRRCPGLVVVEPRHSLYADVSQHLHAIFNRYTPQFEPLALDEAFLDITASQRLFGSPESIGRRIKGDIFRELGLVASVGVAPNKFLAKLASDLEKPDGFVVIDPGELPSLLDPLPIGRLWGIGRKSAARLERLGLTTIGRFRRCSLQRLSEHLGASSAQRLLELAHGRDERPVVSSREAKSISHETTFPDDITDPAAIRGWLLELTEQVGVRLRSSGLKGRTVELKLRYADFSTLSRRVTLAEPTHTTSEIWRSVRQLFEHRVGELTDAVRLVGVGVSGFDDGSPQLDLGLEEGPGQSRRLDTLVDAIEGRFGRGHIRRGLRPRR